jgi:transcription elongation factor Elf1
MLYNLDSVSSWYVLHQGFKVHEKCLDCQSQNISYFKVRTQTHKGIAPKCDDCGKVFSIKLKLIQRETTELKFRSSF